MNQALMVKYRLNCTGLENRRGEIHREFESHRTRQKKPHEIN